VARMLPVKRTSLDQDNSSALYRQERELQEHADEHGHVIVGWVSDETVSGAVNLDDRASLGKWLHEPLLHEWDVMLVTEQDRVTRDDLHWWGFVARLLAWGKRLVVLDDPDLDLSTPNGRQAAGAKATAAARGYLTR
jgi:site-specific DNA recombinase